MNKNLQRILEPNTRMFFIILLLFAVSSYFFSHELAYVQLIVLALLSIYSIIMNRSRRKNIVDYIDNVTYAAETAQKDTLANFPLPMIAFKLQSGGIVWGNKSFFELFSSERPRYEAKMSDYVQDFSYKWLVEGKLQYPDLVEIADKKYRVYGNIVRGDKDNPSDYMGITYWLDVTDYDNIKIEYKQSRPVVSIIVFDNLDEITKNQTDRVKTEIQNKVYEKIENWCKGTASVLVRYARDKYLFVCEQRYYEDLVKEKFPILTDVREVINPQGVAATLSLGIGQGGGSFEENYGFAKLSAEMALTRGGDQVVIKNHFNFEFFGGRGEEIETRTKVKSRVMANALSELIKSSDKVLVMGHKFGDMDCVGAAAGMCAIARELGKEASIVVDLEKNAAKNLITYLKKAPEYKDTFITGQDAIMHATSATLLVVVDTNRPEQVEDQNLLLSCNRVAVVDHHRRAASYIENASLSLLEPNASSACELVCELMQEILKRGTALKYEFNALLTGLVMDTKNFNLRTSERTFDAAAYLRRGGADTIMVKKLLQNDMNDTVARYNILQRVKRYRENIAIAVIDEPQNRIVAAQAADEMLNIIGITASIVIFPTPAGGVIISARSIGDINVQVLLEEMGGGGNKSAAGLQVPNAELRDVVNELFAAIDKYFEQ